jgi:hypothetical protein
MDTDAGKVDKWVSVEEAAKLLGKSEKTVRRYIKVRRLDTDAVQAEETPAGFRYRLDRAAVQALADAGQARASTYPADLERIGRKLDEGLDTVAARFEAAVQPIREQVDALARALPPMQEERDRLEQLSVSVEQQAEALRIQADQIAELMRELAEARRPWLRRLFTRGNRDE